ncbi:MAG TPA: hypothetical protein VFR44_06225 [Actinomycetota bacterium]|nr:hypothetical protein [Actinomycetota bacterium]
MSDDTPNRARGGGRSFFTNWREYQGPFGRKVRLTLRNRTRAVLLLKGCCGHPGEPGC